MLLNILSILLPFFANPITTDSSAYNSPVQACINFTYTDFEVDEFFSRAVATSLTPTNQYNLILRYQTCECALSSTNRESSFKIKVLDCLRQRLLHKTPGYRRPRRNRNLPVS